MKNSSKTGARPRPGDERRGRTRARDAEQQRRHVSVEAARIMADEGVRDFHLAKRKAADRLNVAERKHLPSNEEIEAALKQHLALFHGDRLARDLRRMREIALQAMRFLQRFNPRLVGPVLTGLLTAEAPIQLHIAADSPEEVGFLLSDHSIPHEQTEKRLRFGGERYEAVPVYRFDAESTPIEVYVFRPEDLREPPLSPVDGRPMRRATLKEVAELPASRSA